MSGNMLSASGSTDNHVHPRPSVTAYNIVRLAWVVVVIVGELGPIFWALSSCRWPAIGNSPYGTQRAKPTHILLIADTQVQTTSPLLTVGLPAFFRRALADATLRKNWHVASRLNPNVIIFLGDMLANGRGASSLEEYQRDVQKFKTIFNTRSDTEVHYVPGNEDVGLGSISASSSNLRAYYAMSFGPLNSKFEIANHTFVGLDAPGLVDEDYKRHATHITFDEWKPITGGAVSFVKDVSTSQSPSTILLSHIPLSRPETANCGPLRERGNIRRSAGPGYQSMLGKHTTSFLLKRLDPILVFSGDNHDYCDYMHVVSGAQTEIQSSKSIREVTIKSFANSPHVKRSGFQLLSLVDPSTTSGGNAKSYSDHLCLLPDHHRTYTSIYLPGLILTFLALLILRYRGSKQKVLKALESPSPLTPLSRRSSGMNTPTFNLDPAQLSAMWSPYSPTFPSSPRLNLPADLRVPRSPSASTAHLIASLPGSPSPSSPSTFPISLYSGEAIGDDEDTMYPAHYVTRRDSYSLRQREDDEWTQIRDDSEDYDVIHDEDSLLAGLPLSQNLKAESHQRHHAAYRGRRPVWEYTFVLGGRRRRIALTMPSWTALNNLLDFFGWQPEISLTMRKRKRGMLTASLFALLGILWPAMIMWVTINEILF